MHHERLNCVGNAIGVRGFDMHYANIAQAKLYISNAHKCR